MLAGGDRHRDDGASQCCRQHEDSGDGQQSPHYEHDYMLIAAEIVGVPFFLIEGSRHFRIGFVISSTAQIALPTSRGKENVTHMKRNAVY